VEKYSVGQGGLLPHEGGKMPPWGVLPHGKNQPVKFMSQAAKNFQITLPPTHGISGS